MYKNIDNFVNRRAFKSFSSCNAELSEGTNKFYAYSLELVLLF